jgi:hypothetical protein
MTMADVGDEVEVLRFRCNSQTLWTFILPLNMCVCGCVSVRISDGCVCAVVHQKTLHLASLTESEHSYRASYVLLLCSCIVAVCIAIYILLA